MPTRQTSLTTTSFLSSLSSSMHGFILSCACYRKTRAFLSSVRRTCSSVYKTRRMRIAEDTTCRLPAGEAMHPTHATVARRYRFKELHCSHRRAKPVQRCNGSVKPAIYADLTKSGITRFSVFRPGEPLLKSGITRFNSLV